MLWSLVARAAQAARFKLRDLKSGKAFASSHDDVPRSNAGLPTAIAVAGLPVFVAWKLPSVQVGPSAGKIADFKPIARQKRWQGEKKGRMAPFENIGS